MRRLENKYMNIDSKSIYKAGKGNLKQGLAGPVTLSLFISLQNVRYLV